MRVGVGFVSGLVRIGRLIVGTCPAMLGFCRDVIDVVSYCRNVFGEVGLVSGLVLQGRVSVGTCSASAT